MDLEGRATVAMVRWGPGVYQQLIWNYRHEDGAPVSNRLGAATSPYLLQHKDNPVHWREWGKDAFAEARRRDVPILLSVGYAACHWCHVMAHESFEDPETAEYLNAHFVPIK